MNAESAVYKTYDIQGHLILSNRVPQTFRIKVLRPVDRSDGSERFPVVYATDADEYFGAYAALASNLQYYGETPRFILVGIGYENAREAGLLRMRDFYLPDVRALLQTEIEQFARSPFAAGSMDLKRITETTGAQEFLQFIQTELKPFICARYPALPGDESYFGYSSGGAFGLYTLFNDPGTFKRYILGSPVSSYNGRHFGIELAESFVRSGRQMDAKVFVAAGELEEFTKGLGRFEILTGAHRLAKFLEGSPIPGLDFTLRIFPGETHATAWPLAFSHGLKTLFGPAERGPYAPEYLQ